MTTLTPAHERGLLGRQEATPRERAARFGLTTRAYVEAVYDLPPAPEATALPRLGARRPARRLSHADQEARARAIIADLAAGQLATGAIAARHRVSPSTVRDIRVGRSWPNLPRPWEGATHA